MEAIALVTSAPVPDKAGPSSFKNTSHSCRHFSTSVAAQVVHVPVLELVKGEGGSGAAEVFMDMRNTRRVVGV